MPALPRPVASKSAATTYVIFAASFAFNELFLGLLVLNARVSGAVGGPDDPGPNRRRVSHPCGAAAPRGGEGDAIFWSGFLAGEDPGGAGWCRCRREGPSPPWLAAEPR